MLLGSITILLSMLCLRQFFYYPFHNPLHLLSMSGNLFSPVFLLYKICVSFLGNFAGIYADSAQPALGFTRSTFVLASLLLVLLCYDKHHKHR